MQNTSLAMSMSMVQHLIDEGRVAVSPPSPRNRAKPRAADLLALARSPLVLPPNPHSLGRLLDHYQQQERAAFRVIAEANATRN
ncbi:hypothetical protein [Achromobacter sp. Bel]|uniref:hypothetical protein n=1 Tax=Achromobacter sp. Bel TaxID=2727415 RepID=UPI0020070FBB|nr:hypothetical protein [Achromobacter sp. Bel]